jgi:hypothetical protein
LKHSVWEAIDFEPGMGAGEFEAMDGNMIPAIKNQV